MDGQSLHPYCSSVCTFLHPSAFYQNIGGDNFFLLFQLWISPLNIDYIHQHWVYVCYGMGYCALSHFHDQGKCDQSSVKSDIPIAVYKSKTTIVQQISRPVSVDTACPHHVISDHHTLRPHSHCSW